MSALVVDLDRVRFAARSAHLHRETRQQAVDRTLAKIAAESRDADAHAARMATGAYDARLRRHVSAYEAPGAKGGTA